MLSFLIIQKDMKQRLVFRYLLLLKICLKVTKDLLKIGVFISIHFNNKV